jgi:copper(I)-binding protein
VTRRKQTRRVLLATASGLLGLALAGCGAGLDAPTSQTLESVPGVDADVAGIAVRNALVPFAAGGYAPGEDAPLQLWVVNNNQEPVRLVAASAESVGSVTVTRAVQVGAPAGPEAVEPTEPAGTAGPELAVAPGALVSATLQLTGLGQPLDGTALLPVTLTFDNGAAVSLEVSMAPPLDPQPREPMDLGEEH